MAPVVRYDIGVPRRPLKKLIANSQEVLGEGKYGSVVGVRVDGCDPLCIKVMLGERVLVPLMREAGAVLGIGIPGFCTGRHLLGGRHRGAGGRHLQDVKKK